MEKGKRLTVRVDDELDAAIVQSCLSSACDKTTVIINALRRGLGMKQDHVKAAEPQTKVIPVGKVRPTYVIDASVPRGKVSGLEIDGKRYTYCERCKQFYRRDENGKPEFWTGQFER